MILGSDSNCGTTRSIQKSSVKKQFVSDPNITGQHIFMRSLTHQRLEVLENQKQVERIACPVLEIKFAVPMPGFIVLGVYEHSSNTGYVSSQQSAAQRILEQRTPQPLAFEGLIDGQPRQNHHWHQMSGQPLDDPLWC